MVISETLQKIKMEFEFGINVEKMAEAGIHFGRKSSKRHPKMAPVVFGTRNSIDIIALEKSAKSLEDALSFIKESVSHGKTILFVGTKIQHKKITEEAAKICNSPYVVERWLGGTFTNFENIRKRVEYFLDQKEKYAAGGFEKYTKKEQLKIKKEIGDLEKRFSGIKDMARLPEIIFVADMEKDAITVKEAKDKNVAVIGVASTSTDPSEASYPIYANNSAVSSVSYILEKIKEVILKFQKPRVEEIKKEVKSN